MADKSFKFIPQEPPISREAPLPSEEPESSQGRLAEQLGTDPKRMMRGEWDIRLFSVIDEKDIPVLIYAKIRSKKSTAWKTIYDEYPHWRVSLGGRGRRDAIRGEAVQKGGIAAVEQEIPKPNWVRRNITQRNWRQKAEQEML